MGLETDESDEVLPDQHPCPRNRSVSAIVLATQCRRTGLWLVSVDTRKDCRITAGPVALKCLSDQSRFYQDDREIGFLTIQPPEGRPSSADSHDRPVSPLNKKSALSSW